jgi:hypothetical protein
VVLAPNTGGIAPRITVSDWHGVADELFQLIHGRRPRIVAPDILRTMIAKSEEAAGVRGFTQRFLLSEWTNVVDAWGIDGPERYASVPRLGRRSPLGPRQRERLWSVFGPVAAGLREQGIFTRCGVCRAVAAHYGGRGFEQPPRQTNRLPQATRDSARIPPEGLRGRRLSAGFDEACDDPAR